MYSSGVDSAQVSPLTVTVKCDKRLDNDNPAPTKVAPKGRGKRAGLQSEAPSCVAVSQQSPPQVMTVDSSEGVEPVAPWGRHQTNTPRKQSSIGKGLSPVSVGRGKRAGLHCEAPSCVAVSQQSPRVMTVDSSGSIATSLSPVSTIRSPIASSPWSTPQVQPEQDTRQVSPRVMLVDYRRWFGAGDSCSLPDITRLTSPRSHGRPGKRKQQRNTVPPTAQLESVETGTALRSVVEHQGAGQAKVCRTVAAIRDLRATVYPDGMTPARKRCWKRNSDKTTEGESKKTRITLRRPERGMSPGVVRSFRQTLPINSGKGTPESALVSVSRHGNGITGLSNNARQAPHQTITAVQGWATHTVDGLGSAKKISLSRCSHVDNTGGLSSDVTVIHDAPGMNKATCAGKSPVAIPTEAPRTNVVNPTNRISGEKKSNDTASQELVSGMILHLLPQDDKEPPGKWMTASRQGAVAKVEPSRPVVAANKRTVMNSNQTISEQSNNDTQTRSIDNDTVSGVLSAAAKIASSGTVVCLEPQRLARAVQDHCNTPTTVVNASPSRMEERSRTIRSSPTKTNEQSVSVLPDVGIDSNSDANKNKDQLTVVSAHNSGSNVTSIQPALGRTVRSSSSALASVVTQTALRSVVEHQGQAEVCTTVAAVRDLRATVYPDGMTPPSSNIVKMISMGMVRRQVRMDMPNAGKTPIPCSGKAHVETSEQQQIQRTQPTQSTQLIQSTQHVQLQSPEQKETPCSEQTLVHSAVRVDCTSPVSAMKEEPASVGSGSVHSCTALEVPEYKDELLDSVMKKEVPCHADVPCHSEVPWLTEVLCPVEVPSSVEVPCPAKVPCLVEVPCSADVPCTNSVALQSHMQPDIVMTSLSSSTSVAVTVCQVTSVIHVTPIVTAGQLTPDVTPVKVVSTLPVQVKDEMGTPDNSTEETPPMSHDTTECEMTTIDRQKEAIWKVQKSNFRCNDAAAVEKGLDEDSISPIVGLADSSGNMALVTSTEGIKEEKDTCESMVEGDERRAESVTETRSRRDMTSGAGVSNSPGGSALEGGKRRLKEEKDTCGAMVEAVDIKSESVTETRSRRDMTSGAGVSNSPGGSALEGGKRRLKEEKDTCGAMVEAVDIKSESVTETRSRRDMTSGAGVSNSPGGSALEGGKRRLKEEKDTCGAMVEAVDIKSESVTETRSRRDMTSGAGVSNSPGGSALEGGKRRLKEEKDTCGAMVEAVDIKSESVTETRSRRDMTSGAGVSNSPGGSALEGGKRRLKEEKDTCGAMVEAVDIKSESVTETRSRRDMTSGAGVSNSPGGSALEGARDG